MIVKSLGDIDFKIIMTCFLKAFENYFVEMPKDYDYYRARWKTAKVDYDLSYGMFDGTHLVGFIINAIDKRNGELIAYNTGTGVIPDYRGRKIVKSIYEYAIPELKKNEITKCTLEVITENIKAIKAYEGIGFKIYRTLKCYGGEIFDNEYSIQPVEIKFKDIDWKHIPNQKFYSWDFHRKCLEQSNSKFFLVHHNDELESYFSINPDNGTINQFEVFSNDEESWKRLFSAIQMHHKKVRTINVDQRLKLKINALLDAGLENTVNQYEMELFLETEPVEVK